MNTFSEAAIRKCSSKYVLLKISQCSELKIETNAGVSCKKQPRDVNILIDFLLKSDFMSAFIFTEQVYPSARFSMYRKNRLSQL